MLKYIYNEKNPDVKSQNYINQLLKTEGKEVTKHKELLGETVVAKYKANRILVDGMQTGYFMI